MAQEEKATKNIMHATSHTDSCDLAQALKSAVAELYHLENNLPEIRAKGELALQRLLPVAFYSSGQSSVVARFLLNLDRGDRFPFDMTDLRRLDCDIHEDCLLVLKMDHNPLKKVHQYFEDGSTLWESLAKKWGSRDDLHTP
ncbi:DUF7673 family protein [Massilia rhizosphaerae]|uniref:DUF7673 family protein n=1 Tax=Massilia rhizosphaerae TaxID=2784389 RepID=UPI0018DC4484|nr:hypothetical protein [Massilia rhizosphaerae]